MNAAIALRQRGFDVTVYEQADALGEIGAGIQLSPNASRVLMALGLDKDFEAIAFEPNRHVVRNWKSGSIVSATQMKGVFRPQYGAGYFGAHRADLHAVLQRAVPASAIRLNANCTGVTQIAERAVITFADGSQAEADVVIGADGIRSAVRASLFGPDAPRFTGHIVLARAGADDGAAEGADRARHDGVVRPQGHGRALLRAARRDRELDRALRGRLARGILVGESDWREAAEAYAGWHPLLAELFSRTERCYKWALYDRDPLPRWTQGRVTLLGDAAHPMLPYLAQGAAQAIEDGYVLADMLAQHRSDPQGALVAYEQTRLPRTARIQLHARERGKINNTTSAFARFRRDIGYRLKRLIKPNEHTYKIEWIYGHDVTAGTRAKEPAAAA